MEALNLDGIGPTALLVTTLLFERLEYVYKMLFKESSGLGRQAWDIFLFLLKSSAKDHSATVPP